MRCKRTGQTIWTERRKSYLDKKIIYGTIHLRLTVKNDELHSGFKI